MASASTTFNTLQQQHHLLSITFCKYTFKPHYFISHVSNVSSLRHTFHHCFSSLPKATINAKLSSTQHKTDSVIEEKMGRKNRKDSYVRKDVESRRKREMGSGFSSVRPVDENGVVRINKTGIRPVGDDKVVESKKSSSSYQIDKGKKNKSSSKGKLGDGKMDKKSKKSKVECPEAQLRARLDMCSKRGDFVDAISFYESAQREGIVLGQYHYTVLLYLCSSAAVGTILPAKSGSGSRSVDKMDLHNDSSVNSVDLSRISDMGDGGFDGKEDLTTAGNDFYVKEDLHGNSCPIEIVQKVTNGSIPTGKGENDSVGQKFGGTGQSKIHVGEDVKRYALMKGFEIYEKMCSENIPLNEATLTSVARMAMSMGNGDMAFEMVKKMKELGIKQRLRSYGPALLTFCNSGNVETAFMVEEHMLANGVYPEEPELEALLRLSIKAGRGDKVYYILHKLRTSVRQVSLSTADLVESWFRSNEASRVGKRKWDQQLILESMENGGGGWHGQGWLGKGKWTVTHAAVGTDGVCEGCGEKLVTIDLDSFETESFAKSVASIAAKRERRSSFQNFQKWLEYYGPFEAVVDAANVGLFSQRKFLPSKVNLIVNGIRQKLPSKKWPLIIVHNKRITGDRMEEPSNKMLLEKWNNADALYPTPTGSNDDWYWLYAAIKCKALLVTNDEMRDHVFQLLGNDFFPRWKERHQVRFSFSDSGPEFHMPPPCSIVIQESEKGHWHIPIVSEHASEGQRSWLCVTRASAERNSSLTTCKDRDPQITEGGTINGKNRRAMKLLENMHTQQAKRNYSNLKSILTQSVSPNHQTLLHDIESAEKLGGCTIDFQI